MGPGADSEFAVRGGPFERAETSDADIKFYPWADPANSNRYSGSKEGAEGIRSETDCTLLSELPYGAVQEAKQMRAFQAHILGISDTVLTRT